MCVICGWPAEPSPSGTTYGRNPDPWPLEPWSKGDEVCCAWCDDNLVQPLRGRLEWVTDATTH